jgi:hypothetical protein
MNTAADYGETFLEQLAYSIAGHPGLLCISQVVDT